MESKSDYVFQTNYPELEAVYDFASKAVRPSDIDMVVSHGNCSDGFMSRTIVEKAMRADPSKFKKIEDVLFVDGYYAGVVDDFDGFFQRLTLEVGPHEIAIEAPGFETLVYDVYVDSSRTVDVHGDLLYRR